MKTRIAVGLALAVLTSLAVVGLAGAHGPDPYAPAFPPGFYKGYNQGVWDGLQQRYDNGSAAPLFMNVPPDREDGRRCDSDHKSCYGGDRQCDFNQPSCRGGDAGFFDPRQEFLGGPWGGFHSGPYFCYRDPYISDGYFTYYYSGGNYFYAGFNLPACRNVDGIGLQPTGAPQ